jgi:NADH-quinone oxidoreductase subunit N
MEHRWHDQLNDITASLSWLLPELVLTACLLILITSALFRTNTYLLLACCAAGFAGACGIALTTGLETKAVLFNGMLHLDGFSLYLKILMDIAGVLTCFMSVQKPDAHRPEYFALLTAVVLGGHLLVMSTNFLVIFLSLELISLSSYVLAGYAFTKPGSEASLKYFLFGSVASAVMLYGFSILYGITGTLDFSTREFFNLLMAQNSSLAFSAALMALAGFLYKIAAAPMHPWAPDVYEASPMPVIAFLSVAPKLAGLGVLLKFVLAVNLFGQSIYNWQAIVCALVLLSITIGNFSALKQQSPKRLMAYSSIAQSGFLLVGVASFLPQGVHFMLFYAGVYVLSNFAVFIYLDFFEKTGTTTIAEFKGMGKSFLWPSVFLLVALISLTGLPPTAGFTSKLFIFSAIWQSYELSGNSILLWVLILGLLNTVVSLFYYLRMPYFAFLKNGKPAEKQNIVTFQNLLGFLLVLFILVLFFIPSILMGWINKINFVL